MINRFFLFLMFSTLTVQLLSMEPPQEAAKIKTLCSVHSGILLPKVALRRSAVKRNVQIVGINTTDKYQVMLLKTVLDESNILKQSMREHKDRGFLVRVLLSHNEFNALIPYLRLGALPSETLLTTLEAYSKKEWKNCRKLATQYRIHNLRRAVLEVGVKKGWLRIQDQKKERINHQTNPL